MDTNVLQRPSVMTLTGPDHRQSVDLVSSLISHIHDVQIHFSGRPILTDESGNKFIEAVIHTGATIVT